MATTSAKKARKDGSDNEERIRARNEAAILAAAIDLFARKGFDGTRIAEVAEHSGLPKANVYYYFPAKEDIYRALIDRLIASWDTALEELQPERDPAEAIMAYIRAKLDYSRRFAAQSKLFANEIRWGRWLSRRCATGIDVIHCGEIRPVGYAVWWAHKRTDVPYVIYVNGGDLLRERQP